MKARPVQNNWTPPVADCVEVHPHSLHMECPKRRLKSGHTGFVLPVCGKPAHHICALCKDHKHKDGVPLHKPPTATGEPTCFCQCHNTLFCGLAKEDTRLTGTKRKDCCHPTQDAIAEHGDTIKRLRQQQEQPRPTVLQPGRVDNDENVAVDAGVEVVAPGDVLDVFVRNGTENGLI